MMRMTQRKKEDDEIITTTITNRPKEMTKKGKTTTK